MTFLARRGFRQFAVEVDEASGGFSVGEEVAGVAAPGIFLLLSIGLFGLAVSRRRAGSYK